MILYDFVHLCDICLSGSYKIKIPKRFRSKEDKARLMKQGKVFYQVGQNN